MILRSGRRVFRTTSENSGGFYSICFMGTYDWFLTKLSQADVLVDGGANIGVFSILAASRCKWIYAIEPHPSNYALLCQNLKANHVTNVTPIRAALYDSDGEATLAGSGEVGHLSWSGTPVRTMTFDRLGDPRISALKLDIEGAECAVLYSTSVIRNLRLITYERDQFHLDLVNQLRREQGLTTPSYTTLKEFLRSSGFALSDYSHSGINVAEKVLTPYFLAAEFRTGFKGLRGYLKLRFVDGKDLLSLETLADARIETIYAER